MERHSLLSALCFCLTWHVNAQVQVDAPIVLTGGSSNERQVTGLEITTAPTALLTAGVDAANAHRAAGAMNSGTWNVELPALTDDPEAGLQIIATVPVAQTGIVDILINGHGPFPLIHAPQWPVDLSTVAPGTALSMVFDGASFHLMNGSRYERHACPDGLVAVNSMFCAEPADRAETGFFTAISTCGALGLRLCGWGEYIVMCQNAAALGMTGLTTGWEWADDAVNENGTARMVGGGSCTGASAALVSGSLDRGFRCCYTR